MTRMHELLEKYPVGKVSYVCMVVHNTLFRFLRAVDLKSITDNPVLLLLVNLFSHVPRLPSNCVCSGKHCLHQVSPYARKKTYRLIILVDTGANATRPSFFPPTRLCPLPFLRTISAQQLPLDLRRHLKRHACGSMESKR